MTPVPVWARELPRYSARSAQGELADAPVQREPSELRLGRVRREDFHLPAAQVLDRAAQVQSDFDALCRDLVIVVEQVGESKSDRRVSETAA